MRKIIDFHAHMGDIFMGQNFSFRTGQIRPEEVLDSFAENGRNGFTFKAEGKTADMLLNRMREGQKRVSLASLENIGKSMDLDGTDYVVAHPILPYTNFEEYLAASRLDPRLIPFTSPDFTLSEADMLAKLEKDIARGARGIKIHAVLQNVPINDPRSRAAVRVFGQAGLPVLVHVGVSHYYLPDQNYPSTPDYGKIEDFVALARHFPDYALVAAHCGNNYPTALAEMTAGLNNVYTDTSFCSAVKIAEVTASLGEDRVLFGTDYPFSGVGDAAGEVEKAFPDNAPLRHKILFGNAARLLRLDN